MSPTDALVHRLTLERFGLSEPARQEEMVTTLSSRLQEAEALLEHALEGKEEMSERAQYWESRALHAEGRLAPRERLYVVPKDGA